MQSSALNSQSNMLFRSPSGAQRRIRQRMGGDWPLQKSSLIGSSTENLEPYDPSPSSPGINIMRSNGESMGYRNLIESSGYQDLLDQDLNSSAPTVTTTRFETPIEEKLSNWSLSASLNKYNHLNDSSNSLNSSFGSSSNSKPTPMPRSHDHFVSTPQTLNLNGRQRHNSGSSNSVSKSSADNSFNLTGSPQPNKLTSSPSLNMSSQLIQSPIKPTVHVHPFPVPREKPLPPPIPEKPKNLQAARLKSIELTNKSTTSMNDLDINQSYSNLDTETLIQMENQRIATLTTLYEKVDGRWNDLKNLHDEKKKNNELFQQTMVIVQRNGISTNPFLRFIKRFEAVYEVQTRLVLNKQQLRKSLENTKDNDFLMPLIEQNDSNTQDIEHIVDELDSTFRQLDEQLCQILEPDQHERWVFFVRTLYSLIAEQTSIQFKVRYVSQQIKKLEEFSFKHMGLSRSANTSSSSDAKDVL